MGRRAWAAGRRHLRRAPFLVVLGLGWAVYGSGIIADPRYGTSRGLVSITRHVPLNVLGWGWVVCGAVAVLAGLACRGVWGQGVGFAALASPATLWACAYIQAWSTGVWPSARGSAGAWLAFAIGIYLVSGMQDPPPKGVVIPK
ncbi:hypothetical protein [Kitasatospora cineracea]|uniref:hypothetical protein n=1 Tax=Kitasatospora cineracea TaxID=88074 RepID=UPI00378EDE1C